MRVLEDFLKPILESRGIAVPVGGYAPESLGELDGRLTSPQLVVKALTNANDRKERGEIRVVARSEIGGALTEMARSGAKVWVEDFVPHTDEFFLGVVWSGESDVPTALFSTTGGSGVVERASSDGMRSEPISPGARPEEVAARLVGDNIEVFPVAVALLEVFEEIEALSIELNPVVINAGGIPVVLDAKAYLDPYGTRNGDIRRQQRAASDVAQVPIEYVALDGAVGVLSIGAGLTRAVIDWLSIAGPGAACFTDLISSVLTDAAALLALQDGPTCTDSSAWLARELKTRGVDTLLVCLVSGGTPTDALSRSVIAGLKEWEGRTVSFVAGNRAGLAQEIWTESGFPSPPTLAEAIDAVSAVPG